MDVYVHTLMCKFYPLHNGFRTCMSFELFEKAPGIFVLEVRRSGGYIFFFMQSESLWLFDMRPPLFEEEPLTEEIKIILSYYIPRCKQWKYCVIDNHRGLARQEWLHQDREYRRIIYIANMALSIATSTDENFMREALREDRHDRDPHQHGADSI